LIMAEKPVSEFGKRRPAAMAAAEPVKRSGHVGLLVMGALAVGGGAYALMPRENCVPQPGMAASALPQSNAGCTSRGGSASSGGYGRSSSFGFYGSDSSRSSSTTASDSTASGVTRGGFGSFARAFGFSGRS
jgi:hypothetical protein